MWLIALLVLVPMIEIGLFIEIGGEIGLFPTLAMVIVTAMIGASLMRAQGFSAMRRMQEAMERGDDPRGPMADGALVLLAGVLMLTPGFFTDALGFVLLIPSARGALLAWAGPRLATRAQAAAARRGEASRSPNQSPSRDGPITVPYEVLDDDERQGDSGWTRPPGQKDD